jgi:hypothetical protein
MDNPISNNIEVNNSISNLSFLWTAVFKDYSYISQLENGIEHRFQEIKERFNELKYFSIYNKDTNQYFIIDLEKGLIYNNHISYNEQDLKEKKENIRLIYFRRNRITMSESGQNQSHTVTYHLGYQYLDNLGNNQKIILRIDSEGNFAIGE